MSSQNEMKMKNGSYQWRNGLNNRNQYQWLAAENG